MTDPVGDHLQQARSILRRMQSTRIAPDNTRPTTDASVLPDTLQFLDRYRHFQLTHDPYVVRRGGLKFNPALEIRRIELAEEIAKRVDPGPAEDPSRFAIMSYAAASIAMGFPDELSQRIQQNLNYFLFGSVNSQEIQAGYGLIETTGMSIVYVSSALTDLLVQAAKIVVMVTKAPALPGTTAREDFRSVAVKQRLDCDSTVVNRLYQLLKAYIYDGSPHAFPEEVDDPSNLPLGTLISMANRWVIAHECGHGSATAHLKHYSMTGVQEEFFADCSAMIMTAYSATRLEGLPPELGAMGGVFFLACDDVLQRAIAVARTGKERAREGGYTHPSNESRAIAMVNAFGSLLEVSYESGDISMQIREEAKTIDTKSPEIKLLRNKIFGHARALLQIWDRARLLILEDFKAGRQPHAIWK